MCAWVGDRSRQRLVYRKALLCLAMLGWAAGSVRAEDHFWSSLGGGSFNDWENWVPNWVPGEDDRAIFSLGMDPAYEVTFYEGVTNLSCVFRTDKVALDLGGETYTLTSPGWGLSVGEDAGQAAEVLFYNGTLSTDTARIGTWAGSSGTLDLVAPLTMNVALYLFVGNEGDGLMNVNDGVSLTADFAGLGVFGVGNTGVLSLDGPNAEFTVNYGLTVGEAAYGFLELYNGATVNAETCYVGGESTGYGEVSITDESEFLISEWLSLGRDGSSLLTITGASRLGLRDLYVGGEAAGEGFVYLMDADSRIDASGSVLVGSQGYGSMNVAQQATLSAETLIVGAGEASQGDLTVLDGGTTTTVQNKMIAGQWGGGSINVASGADVRTTESGGWIIVADQVNSVGYVYVDGDSSLTAEQAPIVVGNSGIGGMAVYGGSELYSSDELFMGSYEDSYGQLLISGEASKYTSGPGYAARVGEEGTGELIIEDGGAFEKPGSCFLGIESTSLGAVTLDGEASVFKCEQLSVGEYGIGLFFVGDGRAALGDVDPIDVPSGEMHLAGYYTQLTGTGTVTGNVVSFGSARVMPGGDEAASLTGVLTINGDYTQQDARLAIKIKGTAAGSEYGVLNVTGTATLGGELQIMPIEGFEPQPGDEFVVRTASVVDGIFSVCAGLEAFIVTYNAESVVVTIPYPGDLNCDMNVDLLDVEAFVMALLDPAAYQSIYPTCSVMLADMDGNGTVDGLDIQLFVDVLLAS